MCIPGVLLFSKWRGIFDEDHFIETLREHIRVVKELPEVVLLRFNRNISSIPNMRTKAYSSPNHYKQKVLPKLLELGYDKCSPTPQKKRENLIELWKSQGVCFNLFSIPCRVVRIAPFSNRLAQSVPSNIQALRCLVNYQALRFAEPIRTLAEDMVDWTIKKSSLTGGKYVSVHLRFEEVLMHLLLWFNYYNVFFHPIEIQCFLPSY